MTTQETNDLWQRFIIGEDQALSTLYNCYVHKLFSYGLKIHGDEFLVKDCIQEVFIHLIDRKKKIILSDVSAVYLFKSLHNKLLEELRTKSRKIDITKSISFGEVNYEMSAEQQIIRSEQEQFLSKTMEAALNTLSDYQKEAIFLKYSQGFEYEKIAELLEIDIASARTLIYRSLKKVKGALLCKTKIILFFFRSFRG